MVFLALLMGLAGCPGAEPGPGTSVTFDGQVNASNGDFTMDGQIVENPGTGGFHEYQDVAVVLYAEDGELITSKQVGTLDVRANVTLTTDQVPHYIIIDSPTFWETRSIQVDYYERGADDRYTVYSATSRDELPVTPDRDG